MRLELEDGTVLERPSEIDIEKTLATLVRNANGYAILSQDEMTYIQASGAQNSEYFMEYQAGDTDHHYRVSEPVPLNKVVAAFTHFANEHLAWKTEFQWERTAIGSTDGLG